MYKLQENGYVKNLSTGGTFDPNDAFNRDARKYADWLANGNTPEAIYTAEEQTEKDRLDTNKSSRLFLALSDWKVLRHQDQIALGVSTSLTAQEYTDLLTARQAARDAVSE